MIMAVSASVSGPPHLLPRDHDQSIADDLSYRLIIVPWQGIGIKAVGSAVEGGCIILEHSLITNRTLIDNK